MSPSSPRAWFFASTFGLGSLVACNQLLGIEEATNDPRLSSRAGVQSGGASGSSSEAGTAGTGLAAGTSSSSGSSGSGGSGHDHTPNAGQGGDGDDPGPVGKGGSTQGKAGSSSGAHHTSDAGTSGEGGGGGETNEPVDICETYCEEMETQCQGVAKQYVDRNQCLRVCRILPQGEVDGPDANTAACRLKYAQKTHYGLGAEVTNYCRQAGPSGEGKCGSVCEGFCTLMMSVCTPEDAGPYHFASDQDCLATCEGLPLAGVSYSTTEPQVADGNHALCRLFHVTSAAMADAEEHCEHSLGMTLCEAPPL
jgi:hypothetical protein